MLGAGELERASRCLIDHCPSVKGDLSSAVFHLNEDFLVGDNEELADVVIWLGPFLPSPQDDLGKADVSLGIADMVDLGNVYISPVPGIERAGDRQDESDSEHDAPPCAMSFSLIREKP